ncbi:MAG: GYD domain-containing protein [Nitrososphaerales archaeon]
MIFITLAKFRKKPTKESIARSDKLFAKLVQEGGKVLAAYRTLGRFDTAAITEGPDEKLAMKALLRCGDLVSTETLVALPREVAVKPLE